MNKTGLGGVSPFNVPTRPNAFTPLKPDDVLERRGESILLFRFKPCPCPQMNRSPDCKTEGCFGGYLRVWQETALIDEETAWKNKGTIVRTLYQPIHSVEEIFTFINGKKVNLDVVSTHGDTIEILHPIEYWRKVFLKYRVKMIESSILSFDLKGNEQYLYLGLDKKVLTDVSEAYLNGNDIKSQIIGNDMYGVYFFKPMVGKLNLVVHTSSPVKIGYHSWSLDAPKEESKFPVQSSDLSIVAPTYVQMAEGDIISLLYSTSQTSQYVPFRVGSEDVLTYSPIKLVDSLHCVENGKVIEKKNMIDFIVHKYDRIKWLTPKPQSGYSITYEYHPSFRVTARIEGEGSEDRRKPYQYSVKAVSSFNPRNNV